MDNAAITEAIIDVGRDLGVSDESALAEAYRP